jgi:hypothetical protein
MTTNNAFEFIRTKRTEAHPVLANISSPNTPVQMESILAYEMFLKNEEIRGQANG